ncbi:hypothetical protein [Thaumasiovibrio subtropicus]|uniref:hypothetical protein n=1 Tax=Thaumasiovibrio subtropicus TaxID=1891207 RepID=UPI00131AF49B|nr:hypothetical protein [Thaumasiovibrio subtropicus]
MKKQRGAMSLLITGMLLVGALLFSLGSAKNVFYQTKRAQNEVEARKDHWAAEGGLECAFTHANLDNAKPTMTVADCNLDDLDSLIVSGSTKLSITSKAGNRQVARQLIVSGVSSSSTGVIKSASNLYLSGSVAMLADPASKSTAENEWKCELVRFKTGLDILGAITNQGIGTGLNTPYSTFPTSSSQTCKSTHQTTGITLGLTQNAAELVANGTIGNDFKHDPLMTPFKDTFNVERSQWLDVMYDDNVFRIGTGLPSDKPSKVEDLPVASTLIANCGAKISNAINDGNRVIWVYGGCEISDTTNLQDAIDSLPERKSVALIIHNGIFAVDSALSFKGLLYHFVDDDLGFAPTQSAWESVSDINLKGALFGAAEAHNGVAGQKGIPYNQVSLFNNGSFKPSGGYVLDAPGTYAIFNGSLHALYNRDNLRDALKPFTGGSIAWIEGSWRDY